MIKATIIDSTQAQYTAKEFSWLQDLIMTSGYFATQAGVRTFDVAENAVPNMGVQIKAGKILVPFSKGGQDWKIICETTGESLVTPANALGTNRVDAVIVKIDIVSDPNTLKTNIVTAQYITGTGAVALSDGAINTIIGAGYTFVRLANITVPNGATSVTNSMIAQLLSKISFSPACDINPDAININLGGGLPYLSSDSVYTGDTDQIQTTQNTTVEVGEANATTKKNLLVQSFIPTKTKIRGVRLYKSANTGTFTGTVKISLQADSSGNPSEVDLVSITLSNAVYNAFAVGEFTAEFSAEYTTLDKTKPYWIVVTCSTSDTANHPNLGGNSAGGYANGIVKYKNATDGWLTLAGVDLYFKTLQGYTGQLGLGCISQSFTVNGTYTKPVGAKKVFVQLWSGGGSGGAGGSSTNPYGTGGGGGGYFEKWYEASEVGATETIGVGQGGVGVAGGTAGSDGNDGGASTFGSKITVTGGGKGLRTSSSAAGGAGGEVVGYISQYKGGTGGAYSGSNGQGAPAAFYGGGGGGAGGSTVGTSLFAGGGGTSQFSGGLQNGGPGNIRSGGGGGAGQGGTSGAGARGEVIITTYF